MVLTTTELLRRSLGWTQAHLAERLRADRGDISRIESGRRPVTPAMAERLAEVFGPELPNVLRSNGRRVISMGRAKNAGVDVADEILTGATERSATTSIVGPAGPGVDKRRRSGSRASDPHVNEAVVPGYDGVDAPRRNPTGGDTSRDNFATGRDAPAPSIRKARNGQGERLPRH